MASGAIYKNPVTFALMATVAILIGSVVTMAYPMLRADMHPRLETLKPLTALQLAGRDVYQREGCVGCHTQMVRPLPSEVARYGAPSQAGEFPYEHPFLWGSKRTGPDLLREGGLRPDRWHQDHFANPQAFFAKSNMPSYGWLKGRMLDAAEVTDHMNALALVHPELKTTLAAVQPQVAGKDEMDALVAYMQSLGTAVQRRQAGAVDLAQANPFANDQAAKRKGKKLFLDNCAVCHGDEGHGQPGVAPDLLDDVFLGEAGDMPDAAYFAIISGGSDAKAALGRKGEKDGGMTAFGGQLTKDDIWSVVAWLRAQKAHEKLEGEIK
jgi:cytochrome c oxidase cbb3-type subunit II